MTARKVGIGFVGCGGIATHTMGESSGLDVIQPVVAFDIDREAQERFCQKFGFESAESFEAILDREDVEAVILAAPPYARQEQIAKAAEAGKAVYTEKPLSLSSEDALKAVKVCKDCGVPLMVGQVLRYIGGYARMIEVMRSGEVGKPLAIEIHRYGEPFPEEYRQTWRFDKTLSGGLMFEVHVHELDLARQLCGNPTSVFARMRRNGIDKALGYDDLIMGTIEFENGALGQTHFGQIAPKGETRTILICEGGIMRGNFEGAFLKEWNREEREIPKSKGDDEPPFRKEIRLFAEAVLEEKPVPIPGEEGFWSVAMAEAFERSAQLGQPVAVKEA